MVKAKVTLAFSRSYERQNVGGYWWLAVVSCGYNMRVYGALDTTNGCGILYA